MFELAQPWNDARWIPLRIVGIDVVGIVDAQVERADLLAAETAVIRTGLDHLVMPADARCSGVARVHGGDLTCESH